MGLENLAKQTAELRDGLSRMIVNDPQYLESLKAGAHFFSSQELVDIETKYQDQGLALKQIQEELAKKEIDLKIPTFKKYVGMKLVSGTSSIQKTDKGSIGFYPSHVIRQINLIKYLLESKRDFLECYIAALGATSSNVLQIVQSEDPDALDIVENLGGFRAYAVVKKHLDDLVSQKIVTKAERENVLSKAKDYERACDNIYRASGALQDALENLAVPGNYILARLFEAIKNQSSSEDKEQKDSN